MFREGWRGDIAECKKSAIDDDGSRQTQKIVRMEKVNFLVCSETLGSTDGNSHKTNVFLVV